MKKDRYGVCALTGRSGKLVRSHLLPRARMEFGPANVPIIQIRGDTARPIRRWTSWYDPSLVTRAGEDILERHDHWGVGAAQRRRSAAGDRVGSVPRGRFKNKEGTAMFAARMSRKGNDDDDDAG